MTPLISNRLRDVILTEIGIESNPLKMRSLPQVHAGILGARSSRFAVEIAFGIRIKTLEAVRLKNVGGLHRRVSKKSGD